MTKNYQIDKWFPKVIYRVDNFSENINEDLKQSVLNLYFSNSKRNNYLYVDSTHQTNPKLHFEEPFKSLKNNIQTEIQNFLTEYGYNENICKNCLINDMWVNVSNKGDYNFPHNHAGSLISGVYYVEANDGNLINFYDNMSEALPVAHYPNDYSYKEASYECRTNRLFLFFGNMVHGNPRQDFEGRKIAISFNTLVKYD
tara:strand:+ start:6305 stop:6901 length:597 start_codon:yes stop_codon:yes gene_type:complete